MRRIGALTCKKNFDYKAARPPGSADANMPKHNKKQEDDDAAHTTTTVINKPWRGRCGSE